jgi:transposase-like protein
MSSLEDLIAEDSCEYNSQSESKRIECPECGRIYYVEGYIVDFVCEDCREQRLDPTKYLIDSNEGQSLFLRDKGLEIDKTKDTYFMATHKGERENKEIIEGD